MKDIIVDFTDKSSDWIKFVDSIKNVTKKIEIDLGTLQKGEKRIWVKPTSKRVGHYRKIKGAKPEVITEKKSPIDRIKVIIPNVNLDGATEDQLSSIASGIEDTIGKYDRVNVDSIGWLTSTDENTFGIVDAAYLEVNRNRDKARIILSKKVVSDIPSWNEKNNRKFNARKENNIDYYNDQIKGFGEWGAFYVESVEEYKEKLAAIEACDRLFVLQSEDDSLKGIIMHECYHAIDVDLGCEKIFVEQLEKYNVTNKEKMMVSDYASSKDTELWAEVGSAVESGIEIPDSIRKAFDVTMEAVR